MTGRSMEFGVRWADEDDVDTFNSKDERLKFLARVGEDVGEPELVTRVTSPWAPDSAVSKLDGLMPLTECTNCKGTRLGFECSAVVTRTNSIHTVEFYQGCIDCSETLWTGDWDLFHAFLALVYDIKVPRCD